MFSSKLTTVLCVIAPVFVAYGLGAAPVARALPDSIGSGLAAFHSDVNSIAHGGVSGIYNAGVDAVRAMQGKVQRAKDSAPG